MTTQRARSPRDGSKIDLQSLHGRYNQVTQIVRCLRVSIESEAEFLEPAAICRAIIDMLEDINSDLWTFLAPALFHKIEAKAAARNAATPRKSTDNGVNVSHGTNGLHHHGGALNGSLNGNGAAGAIFEDAAQ
jgi:hypothetical protein